MRVRVRNGDGDAWVNPGGRMNHPAVAIELLAQGFPRPFVLGRCPRVLRRGFGRLLRDISLQLAWSKQQERRQESQQFATKP